MGEAEKIVIRTFASPSSHGAVTYETLLWSDGSTTCDCPGWVYQRAGKPRGCKHTRMVAAVERGEQLERGEVVGIRIEDKRDGPPGRRKIIIIKSR